MLSDKKIFKISMVDDIPDALESELDDIKEYLEKEYGMRLELVRYEKASQITDKIDQTTDIAFIDKNLNDASGIDVIEHIRNKYRLLDVLIYSRAHIENDDLAKINDYGIVEIVQKKERIVDRLKTLIDKNLGKWYDIYYLRGLVISRIIDIEREIDDALMEFFAPHDDSRKEFRNYLLENTYITLFAKKSILGKIANPSNGKPFSLNKLQHLQEYRNMLAHCQRSKGDPNTLTLVQMGKTVVIDKEEIKKIFEEANNFSECLTAFKQKQFRPRHPTQT